MTRALTFEHVDVPVGSDRERLTLRLRRVFLTGGAAPGTRGAVLLLHGGNTSSDTFIFPSGGIARYLVGRGWDVWLLDFRSSPYVLEPLLENRLPLGGSVAAERRMFNLDRVVDEDLPAALTIVRSTIGAAPALSIVGHCLGGGSASMATARGKLEPFAVRSLVLSTMGLFYEAPWTSWLKAEDFLMERILTASPECRGIDPKKPAPWPALFANAYKHWPEAWLPSGSSSAEQMLRRLAFMFGQPYSIDRLAPTMTGAEAERCFGPMHVGFYLHASQLVRRGYADRFDAPDIVDRAKIVAGHVPDEGPRGDLVPTFFRDKQVTLLNAAENHLWHRDAMDLMYEWLRRIGPGTQFKKHVFAGYNIQELFWGVHAESEVFPRVEEALAG